VRAAADVTLFLMVGLPGAGKTIKARELAKSHDALRLTPDEWHRPLLGESLRADGKRDLLEGLLISIAVRTLQLGTSVILDFGLWGRDERSALHWLASEVGVSCRVVYVPVDLDLQLTRIAHRQATAPLETFPMTEAEVVAWRTQFQTPDAAELAGEDTPGPPPGWASWSAWATDRWPGVTLDYF
jgi:predicted kinase